MRNISIIIIEVIIKKGLNFQPGQRLLIMSAFDPGVPIELTSFVRRIVEKAYKSGTKFVDVMWRDDTKLFIPNN